MASKTIAQSLKCDFCDYHPRDQSTLNRHQNQVHLKLKNWHCTLCGQNFGDTTQLKRHSVGLSKKIIVIDNRKFRHFFGFQ
jgi:hypothetical protein